MHSPWSTLVAARTGRAKAVDARSQVSDSVRRLSPLSILGCHCQGLYPAVCEQPNDVLRHRQGPLAGGGQDKSLGSGGRSGHVEIATTMPCTSDSHSATRFTASS